MIKNKTYKTPRRNPMASLLSHGAAQMKVVPNRKLKEARRRKPKHVKPWS